MKKYTEYSKEELNSVLEELEKEYQAYKSKNLHLSMARGKPCQEQLDLSMGMMDVLNSTTKLSCREGTDCRNYGTLGGIEECKELLGDIIECPPENIIIFGNSSLFVMYECIARAYIHGILGSTPWCKLDKIKFLCPVPGYDRHFAITESFGIEMINIPMDENGPDMDMVEKLVSSDESIKGIWCVPKYSNPTGVTYSEEVVKRFAHLKPLAKDFRIFWDNAYSVHHLYETNQDFLVEIVAECAKAGNPDMVYKFTSTSKISFPGSGIAAIASSKANIAEIKKYMGIETIGYDKVNQLRHVRYFKNLDGIKEQMKKHAAILRPKFELVERILEEDLQGLDIATWTKPHGGYFISFTTKNGLAAKIVKACLDVGVELTPAGSAFPYHKDPYDSNIRIAPSYPKLDELELAARILTLTTRIETIKQILAK